MDTLTLGIVSGIFAAFMSSCSYIGGARFLAKSGNAKQLIAASILITGVIAWILAPFFWAGEHVWSWRMLGLTAMSGCGFACGHFSFFLAQKHIESSRIASLLGLKIFVVMTFSMIFIGARYSVMQYAAIAGTVFAAMLMNWEKGHVNWQGMGALVGAMVGYAASDIGIQLVVRETAAPDPISGGMQGFVLINGLLIVVTPFMFWKFKVTKRMIPAAMPQALCWTVAMWGLYVCFGLLGATFGGMCQATRGPISLVLGLILSCCGLNSLEKRHPWTTWVRRAIAALLMFGAIALFAGSAEH